MLQNDKTRAPRPALPSGPPGAVAAGRTPGQTPQASATPSYMP